MFVFIVSFVMYLLLSWSGGMSIQEVTIAFALAVVISLVSSRSPGSGGFWNMKGLSLKRWWDFLLYLFGPFAVGLAQANWDVAKRVITGDINPGIVKFDPRLKTRHGRMMLANSITLTPGTLTVDVDDNGVFYVHTLNLTSLTPTEKDICGVFGEWVRRIMG